jgi:hypothetical protein
MTEVGKRMAGQEFEKRIITVRVMQQSYGVKAFPAVYHGIFRRCPPQNTAKKSFGSAWDGNFLIGRKTLARLICYLQFLNQIVATPPLQVPRLAG